jgi:ribosomal protein S6--L-glutamate ligase
MKLWILSHLEESPGNRLMLEAAAARGHQVTRVDPTQLHVIATSRPGSPALAGPEVEGEDAWPDLVFTRLGSSAPPECFHVLEWLEARSVPCRNRADALRRTRDKATQMLGLLAGRLPLPPTALVGRDSSLDPVVDALAGPPWIVKLPVSTQGSGVILAESRRSLRSICDTLHATGQRLLVQGFVAEAGGADVRVLVVDGTARAAMRRRGEADEFRSNLHRGGTAEEVALTPELVDVAERATAALGLHVAGVDLLEAADGPLVMEVNGSPGLEGLSAATGRDLAAELVTFLESIVEHRTAPGG